MNVVNRRQHLRSWLFGAGALGLRSMATGLPVSFLVNPRSVRAADHSLACPATEVTSATEPSPSAQRSSRARPCLHGSFRLGQVQRCVGSGHASCGGGPLIT